jgi:hypothetical protein
MKKRRASRSRSRCLPNCAAVSQQRVSALREKSSTNWAKRTRLDAYGVS